MAEAGYAVNGHEAAAPRSAWSMPPFDPRGGESGHPPGEEFSLLLHEKKSPVLGETPGRQATDVVRRRRRLYQRAGCYAALLPRGGNDLPLTTRRLSGWRKVSFPCSCARLR